MNIRRKNVTAWILSCAFLLFSCPFVKTALAEDTYGQDAYTYMEYLGRNYPERIATTTTNADARQWLITEIQAIGYEVTTEDFAGSSPLGWGDFFGTNLIFTKKGESAKEFVVAAHYDSAWCPGADDNASGVGVLLETAKRVKDEKLPYSVRFILFDAEEPGSMGSQKHVEMASPEYLENIICMINIDTLAGGDYMMVYGGDYDSQTASFSRLWAYEAVMQLAKKLKIDLRTHPEVNANYPTPTKAVGSDNAAFNAAGIPYIYFEASNWMGGEYTNQFQTSSDAVEGGKIMHCAEYDDIDFLMKTFPERVHTHLHDYSKLVHQILQGKMQLPDEIIAKPESTEESTDAQEDESTSEADTEQGEDTTSTEETPAVSTTAEDTEATTADALNETETEANGLDATASSEPEESEADTTGATAKPTQGSDKEKGTLSSGMLLAIVILVMAAFFILLLGLSFVNERRAEKKRRNRK